MGVPVSGAASKSGSGPSSPQNLVPPSVQDDGQTFAVNQSAPSDGTQYVLSMPPLYYPAPAVYYQPNYVTCDLNEILEKDHMIADLQDQLHSMDQNMRKLETELDEGEGELREKNQFISDLERELEKREGELSEKNQIISELERNLEKEKAEFCAKDSSLREKEAELATCRRNLDHSNTEKRELEGKLTRERAHCTEWYQQQWMNTIWPLQQQLDVRTQQLNRLYSVHRGQVERNRRLAEQLQLEMADNRRLAEQLQLEMANARERTQTHTDESRLPQNDSQDVTQLGQNNGNQQDVNGGGSMNTNSGVLPNGNTDNATSFVSSGKASTLAAVEVSQMSASSQTDQNLTRSDTKYEHDTFVDGQALHSGNLDVHISPEIEPDSVISPSADEEQVLSQENDTNTILVCWGSTGLTSEIRFVTIEQSSDAKEQENVNLTDHGLQGEVANVEEPSFAADAYVSV